jgi:hypothetical protein
MDIRFRYIINTLIAVAYLFTAIGFDIHTCSKSGKTEIILPYGVPECNHYHSVATCSCRSDKCVNSVHKHNCCKNTTYVLADPYTDSRTNTIIDSQGLNPVKILFVLTSPVLYPEKYLCINKSTLLNEFPPGLSIDIHKMTGIWRL